ncbi:cytochrome c3 family protein [Limnobacter humi]|uniref:Cytochrome c3 family protein n=1 Tax=Limnobacter humi TaxID=1778671 RepID=A0ABT1WFI1_9BURK|nr:cytochrome c3 family protein [Limnobacter humi]MCQ8896276.1 cytochrome c3 family protein [Limnobacter humi]
MADQSNHPLQQEVRALQKPLGLKRVVSWLLFAPILLAFLVLPWAASWWPEPKPVQTAASAPENRAMLNANTRVSQTHEQTRYALDAVWNPGPLASAHANLEQDCRACHQGNFSRVKDETCTQCHQNMGEHVTQQTRSDSHFEEGRCASCHRDHKGRESLAEQNKHFVGRDCSSCHSQIEQIAPNTETQAVRDFAAQGHPAFRLTVATGSETSDRRRIRMEKNTLLTENTGLKFPHDVHLNAKGIEGPKKQVVMQCADCHRPNDTGTSFKPVNMADHCQSCHKLNFEPALPDRQVPHGPVSAVLSTVSEFYSYLALHPEEKAKVNNQRAALRARPGEKTPQRSALQNLAGNPQAQAVFATRELFEKTACSVCHAVKEAPAPADLNTSGKGLPYYNIAAVAPAHTWLPMAKFDHKAHALESCDNCHAAKTAKKAEQILIPGIENCQTCHAGRQPVAHKVQSDCGVCHGYHLHPLPPKEAQTMSPRAHNTFTE